MTTDSSETLALIPARGGSKGIPRKNLAGLAGLPLIAYTILQAERTPSVSRVIVSTDDPEIEAAATRYGAEVIRRPHELSTDTASSESALLHALETLAEREGYRPEILVFLQATSPLRRPEDIERALDSFRAQEADSLFSASVIPGFVWRGPLDSPQPISYRPEDRPRRQEAATELIENGSIYIVRTRLLEKTRVRLGGKIAVYEMPHVLSLQIDEPGDLEAAERILAGDRRLRPRAPLRPVDLLVLDFDGVLTDDRVLVSQDGVEAVWCSRSDGFAITMAKRSGLEVLVLSRESNPVVRMRCDKLAVPCHQNCQDKLGWLEEYAASQGVKPERIAYVGNDVSDIDCMRWAGVAIAPADAHPRVHQVADVVTRMPGGRGAVREAIEALLEETSGEG